MQRRNERKKRGSDGNGVKTLQQDSKGQRKETWRKGKLSSKKQRTRGWVWPRQWSWVASRDKKRCHGSGGPFLALYFLSASHWLAPVLVIYATWIVLANRIVNWGKTGVPPECQTMVLDTQTDVSSSEITSDSKSGLTDFYWQWNAGYAIQWCCIIQIKSLLYFFTFKEIVTNKSQWNHSDIIL